jgi:uncharacterized LabA/DUF88 family protein
MSSYIGLVDAGFLKAEGAKALKVARRRVSLNAGGVVAWLHEAAPALLGMDEADAVRERLLRVYWYDGAFDASDSRHASQRKYHDAIAGTPGIQLRLGHLRELTPGWQRPIKKALESLGVEIADFEAHYTFRPEFGQKGVDTLIVLDLVRLAQKNAYQTAVLIAGDRDLAEAVRTAQDEGRRVVVALPRGAGIARELKQLADEVVTLDKAALERMLTVSEA